MIYIKIAISVLVEVDNCAAGLVPGTQVDGSSFSDVGLAGVGFWSSDQDTETGRVAKKLN